MSRAINIAFALLCVLYCCISCLAFTFQDCGSKLGRFTDVSVSSCQTSDPKCTLTRGTNASIAIKFIPNKDISEVDVRAYGVMLNVPVPFPLEKPDACTDTQSGVTCPLSQNQEYHYTTTLFIQKKFPPVSVDIMWELLNSNEEKIICIGFPARIK